MNSDEKAVAQVFARYEKALNESDTEEVMKLYASMNQVVPKFSNLRLYRFQRRSAAKS